MLHEVDPKEDLLRRIGDVSHIRLMQNMVLVATYVRPEKTVKGIILTANTRKEDEYQGKVGLVIAKGPLAFVNDGQNDFKGQDIALHEWISYRQSDGWQLIIRGAERNMAEAHGGWHCRMLQDIDIRAVISAPDDLLSPARRLRKCWKGRGMSRNYRARFVIYRQPTWKTMGLSNCCRTLG
jgi:co-chaperonin GroES (HSP10)